MTIEEFHAGAIPYIERFNAFAGKHGLVGKTAPDHLCYKCGSVESFKEMREMFEAAGKYTYQTIISGRRIAYIKLKQPIETALGDIWFIELSDQKSDNSQIDSYDHIEVFPTQMSYGEMVALLEKTETVVKVERPHHTTHDINIGKSFLFRCTSGPLIEKIKMQEM